MNWFTDVTERQSHCYLTRLKKINLSDSIGVNSCPFFTLYLFVLKIDLMLFTSKKDEMAFLKVKEDMRYYQMSVSFSTNPILFHSNRTGVLSEREQ